MGRHRRPVAGVGSRRATRPARWVAHLHGPRQALHPSLDTGDGPGMARIPFPAGNRPVAVDRWLDALEQAGLVSPHAAGQGPRLLMVMLPLRQDPMEVRVYSPPDSGCVDVTVYRTKMEAQVAAQAWTDGGYVALVLPVGAVDRAKQLGGACRNRRRVA